MTMEREEAEKAARLHFQQRAGEAKALAQSGAFRSCHDQLLNLASRYEALAQTLERGPMQAEASMRRALP
jgi:hypothetical protein